MQRLKSDGWPEIANLLNATHAAAVENFSFVIASEHLLLSILQNCDQFSIEYLRNLGLTSDAVTQHIDLLMTRIGKPIVARSDSSETQNSFVLSPIVWRILDDVKAAAQNSESIETVSLYALLALLNYEDCVAFKYRR